MAGSNALNFVVGFLKLEVAESVGVWSITHPLGPVGTIATTCAILNSLPPTPIGVNSSTQDYPYNTSVHGQQGMTHSLYDEFSISFS